MPNGRRKCSYQFPNSRFCRRWADRGQRFCHHHEPWADRHEPGNMETLHPLDRLATVEDVFDVAREALNAARLGRITPGQAYAVGYLVQVWLQVRKELDVFERDSTLRRQLIPELTQSEEVADEALSETVPMLAPSSEPATEIPDKPERAEAPHAELAAPAGASHLQEAMAGMLREALKSANRAGDGGEE